MTSLAGALPTPSLRKLDNCAADVVTLIVPITPLILIIDDFPPENYALLYYWVKQKLCLSFILETP